jgi:hypothetical protein
LTKTGVGVHAEEADVGSEMSGIAGDFQKSFCTTAEQQIIDNLSIVQSHGRELRRQSENNMDVTRGEKFAAPCGEPPFPSAGLTLWTMAIAYAQLLAGVAILLCPAVLITDSLLARILRTGESRLWPWFGVLAGLGLEIKHSTLSLGFAVTVALLLTNHRREFARPWIYGSPAPSSHALRPQPHLANPPSLPDDRRPRERAPRRQERRARTARVR